MIGRAVSASDTSCRVEFAEDANRAMQILDAAYAGTLADGPPELMLLDLNLPGLTGQECLARIRADERLRRQIVVVLTTSANPEDVQRCYDRACNGFLRKPTSWSDLANTIGRTLTFWLDTSERPSTN